MASIGKVTIKVASWVFWYIKALVWFADVTGQEPDWEKLGKMVERGITVR